MLQERLEEVKSKRLIKGSGGDIDHACVMQMVSYVAGEPWTDRPECSCQTLTTYAIALNDRLDDESRQQLLPLIPILVGTRGSQADRIVRSKFIVWRLLTVTMPIFLDAIGLPEISAELRLTTQDPGSFRSAEKLLRTKRSDIRKDDAAYAAAASAHAAYAAAYAAAADAAYAAAAAADAAYAAYAAAYAAAVDAAYAAAAAAYAAADAGDVRDKINDSAIETLRLACAVKAETSIPPE